MSRPNYPPLPDNTQPNTQVALPRRGRRVWWWVGISSSVLLATALICCGGGYVLINLASTLLAEKVTQAIENDPNVQQRIGTITRIAVDPARTLERSEPELIILSIEGDKGSGEIEVIAGNQDGEWTPKSITVIPLDGERFEIPLAPQEPGDGAPEPKAVVPVEDNLPVDDDAPNPSAIP